MTPPSVIAGASCFVQCRLAALIRQLGRRLGYLKPQVIYRLIDGAACSQVATAAPRSEPRQPGQEHADHLVHLGEGFLCVDQSPLFLGNAEADQVSLGLLKLCVGLRLRRPLPLLPQVQDLPAPVVIEIERPVLAPRDHAHRDEPVLVPAIETQVPRHCCRAHKFLLTNPPRSACHRTPLFAAQHTTNRSRDRGFPDPKYAEVAPWRGPRTNPRAPKNLDRGEG